MSKKIGLLLGLVIVIGVGALIVRALVGEHDEKDEKEKEKPTSRPVVVERSEDGATVLTVTAETQKRIGLRLDALVSATLQPELRAYGAIEADPASTFTLRAPVAGELRSPSDRAWPVLGERLAAGTRVGSVFPRLTFAEQADLKAKRAAAQGEVDEVHASLAAATSSYEQKKTLNTSERIVSDRTIEEAKAKVKGEEARLRTAKEALDIYTQALTPTTQSSAALPLTVDRGGEVVELPSQAGEFVDAGQVLLRVADYSQLLARVQLSPDDALQGMPSKADLVVAGFEDHPLHATVIGIVTTPGVQAQGQTVLLRVQSESLPLRPGLAVTVSLARPGKSLEGVRIPRSAVVRCWNKAWVYVQVEPNHFERREIALDHPTLDGWFLRETLKPGDQLVTTGAAMLLSEELMATSGGAEED